MQILDRKGQKIPAYIEKFAGSGMKTPSRPFQGSGWSLDVTCDVVVEIFVSSGLDHLMYFCCRCVRFY